MGFHAGVCDFIFKKRPSSSYREEYLYIDLNCGAGYQPEYREFGNEVLGSPIIALQELNRKGIEPVCHFCDASEAALTNLAKTIGELGLRCTPHYWQGDNREALTKIAGNLEDLPFQGILYSDPNGKQDFPLTAIKNIFQIPQLRKVDLLMNVATTYVKRWEANPKANWEVYPLEDLINGHGKQRVFIRQPENPNLKWSFIYATNWDKQKNIPKIHLYDIHGPVGREILDHIFNPKSTPRPYIEKNGAVEIQGNLFEIL